MKFPLRLSLDLLRGKVSRASANGRDCVMVRHLCPSVFTPGQEEIEAEANPEAAVMEIPAAVVAQTTAPVLWVGGEEPLQHPVIGRISAALNQAGRNVFLHTDGARLRQRIHEFRPDPRLFLTVELTGREELHDKSVGQRGAFRRVIEGVRAAKLSGFHVCAHVTVNSQTEICEAGELFEFLDRYDVDGYIVSSGGLRDASSVSNVQEKLNEIRALVRCSRWEEFSALLESSYLAPREKKVALPVTEGDSNACEESA